MNAIVEHEIKFIHPVNWLFSIYSFFRNIHFYYYFFISQISHKKARTHTHTYNFPLHRNFCFICTKFYSFPCVSCSTKISLFFFSLLYQNKFITTAFIHLRSPYNANRIIHNKIPCSVPQRIKSNFKLIIGQEICRRLIFL